MTLMCDSLGRRNQNAPILGPEELTKRGALAATNWSMRVDFVEDLMTACSWTPSAGRSLAVLWKLSPSSVSLMSAEASRRILKAYREAPEEVTARLCAGLDYVVQVALNKEKSIGCKQCGTVTTHADPDCNAAIKAQVALAQILGLAPSRHDMELKYEGLDDAALLKTILRAAMAAPHLRPVLLEEVAGARGALIEAVGVEVPEADSRQLKLPGTDSPPDSQGHVAEHSGHDVTEQADGRQGSDAPGKVSAGNLPGRPAGVIPPPPRWQRPQPPPPPRPCVCGHEVEAHYALKYCWKCHCAAYTASVL